MFGMRVVLYFSQPLIAGIFVIFLIVGLTRLLAMLPFLVVFL